MGDSRPQYAPIDGDEPTRSPGTEQTSLLAANEAGATRRIKVDASGNLKVTSQANNSSVLNNGSETNVPSAALTTIVTYTASANTQVSRVSCSGTNYAKYSLVLNTSTIDIKRSSPSRNVEFGPLSLVNTDILDVKVEHFYTGDQEDYEATIYGS
ncbi:MAG: hypothetical protein KAS32_26600 [Candidatus Peribacteraceae bacterium]|nr:hypothetical protein [Candidatus Peribacteraceae bacterium]